MDSADLTNAELSFKDWFDAASNHWDRYGFEEAYDWRQLPWEQWYAAGLTARQAARAAHRQVFGEDLFD